MRILMVGAGCIGSVLTRALEKTKTNEVTYVVRDGKKASYARIKVLDSKSGELSVRERPAVVEWSQTMPVVDTVIFAVRGDQLEDALKVLERVPATARVAVAAAGFDFVDKIRTRFPGRAVVQIVPNLMAHVTDDVIRLWVPPFVKTVVSDENSEDARAFATELAGMFTTGGLPSVAQTSAKEAWERTMALGIPLLAAWEVSGWDLSKLAQSSELRTLAAKSAREALDAVGAKLPIPSPLISATLRAAPLAPKMVREMLMAHGPKIAGQTRMMIDSMLVRARDNGRSVDNLHALRQRL